MYQYLKLKFSYQQLSVCLRERERIPISKTKVSIPTTKCMLEREGEG